MADTKISGLPAGTPLAGDNFVIERGGTANYKVAESVLENTVGTSLAAGTVLMSYVAPGTSGNVLTSNGTAWTSAAPSGGGGGGDWTDATGTWSYSSADAPTFVASVNNDQTAIIYPGQRLSLTQTTEKFFIVTAVGAYSGGNTLITMYGGTDYTLASEAITSPKWSNVKVPSRFPMSPDKWRVEATDTADRNQNTPTQNIWYNLNSNLINIPIGVWRVSYKGLLAVQKTASTTWLEIYGTLSTANNSESNNKFTVLAGGYTSTSDNKGTELAVYCIENLTVASKTPYYFNIRTTTASVGSISEYNSVLPLLIRAECAYL